MDPRTNCYYLLKFSALLLCLLTLTGCATMKDIVRDTHGTLFRIMTLTELDENEKADQLYHVQEAIMESCKPMLESARIKVDGEDIPLYIMLDFLFSFDGCRHSLDAADKEIALLEKYPGIP